MAEESAGRRRIRWLALPLPLVLAACSLTVGNLTVHMGDSFWLSNSDGGERTLVPPTADANPFSIGVDESGIAQTAQIPNARVEYYLIHGGTAERLRSQMDTAGPTLPNGMRTHSITRWSLLWTWPGMYSDDACDLGGAVTSFEISVLLPQWRDGSDAPPELVRRWNEYFRAMAFHEKRHVEIVLRYYDNLLPVIQSADCVSAVTLAQEVVRAADIENHKFDQATFDADDPALRFP